jgi:hypothetical protein
MISLEEFNVILDSMTHNEFNEFERLVDRLPEKSNEAVLEAYYEFKREEATRAIIHMFENDPFNQAMLAGLMWGDMDAPKPRIPELPEEDHDWIMPRMVLRKDIFNNFPVVVKQLTTRDKREVYAVEWHRDNFIKQRNDCDNWCDYDDFEETQYRRLFKALNMSRNWVVEEARHGNELCRIVMVENEAPKAVVPAVLSEYDPVYGGTPPADRFKTANSGAAKASAHMPSSNVHDDWTVVASKTPAYTGPTLARLTDIKAHFPTAFWNKVDGASVSTYNIGLLRKTANLNKTKASLLDALKHSAFWKVEEYQDESHCCRIVMNVASRR